MRYLIADLVTEYAPRFDNLKNFSAPFAYNGDRPTDISISVSDSRLENLYEKLIEKDWGKIENFAVSMQFNHLAIKHDAMLVHSSAVMYNGGAYLFAAQSGVGKSTHTRLWLREFGDRVHIFNDDKPVVRVTDDKAIAYGTPFDGGSGIALNESAPLKAIVFLSQAPLNSIREATQTEALRNLYFYTIRKVNASSAECLLNTFEKLIGKTKFYILKCNMDPSAAHLAYDFITKD